MDVILRTASGTRESSTSCCDWPRGRWDRDVNRLPGLSDRSGSNTQGAQKQGKEDESCAPIAWSDHASHDGHHDPKHDHNDGISCNWIVFHIAMVSTVGNCSLQFCRDDA